MEIKENEIYLGDCIELIAHVKSKSIDAIIADPPYFLGMTHNGVKGTFSDLNICKPFFQKLFEEYRRVLKDTGSVYFFTDWRGWAFYYPLLTESLPVKNMLVWDKTSGPGSYYNFNHELIIYAKDKPSLGKKLGGNVLKGFKSFGTGAKKTNGEKLHPTQKPTELIAKLVNDSTEKTGTVLDTFLGSGTTAVVCKRLGRNYIGFELDEKYFEIAKKRLEAEDEKTDMHP